MLRHELVDAVEHGAERLGRICATGKVPQGMGGRAALDPEILVGVAIYAFALMSNHVHVVVYGRCRANTFARQMRQRTGCHFARIRFEPIERVGFAIGDCAAGGGSRSAAQIAGAVSAPMLFPSSIACCMVFGVNDGVGPAAGAQICIPSFSAASTLVAVSARRAAIAIAAALVPVRCVVMAVSVRCDEHLLHHRLIGRAIAAVSDERYALRAIQRHVCCRGCMVCGHCDDELVVAATR